MTESDPSTRALTARNLEDYATCPQKFVFSVTASHDELEKLLGGPAMLTRAIRSALQDAFGGGSLAELDRTALLGAFAAHFDGRLCADSREEDELRETGRQVLASYARRLARESDDGVTATVGDLQFEGELEGHRFRATADLVLVADGQRDVLRYSMSRKLPTPEELGKDLSVLLLHELAVQRYNDGRTRVVVEALRHDARVAPDFGDGRREEGLAQLARLAGAVRRAREFPPDKGEHCRWCRSRRRCPAWRR
jgi:hypothetical protein